jgi:hypothetical protein
VTTARPAGARESGGSAACHPSYPNDCPDSEAYDYDCEGGDGHDGTWQGQ